MKLKLVQKIFHDLSTVNSKDVSVMTDGAPNLVVKNAVNILIIYGHYSTSACASSLHYTTVNLTNI